MTKNNDFSKWMTLTKAQLETIKNDIIPRNVFDKLRTRVQFALLLSKIPLQMFFAIYQIHKSINDASHYYSRHTAIVVAIYEGLLVSKFFLGAIIHAICAFKQPKGHDRFIHLNLAYTECFQCTRASVLTTLPFISTRQILISFNAVICKIQEHYEHIKSSGPILKLYYAFSMFCLFACSVTCWFVIPSAVIMKIRQMSYIIEDEGPLHWTLQEKIQFLAFLNQLSSICETVELPQVFLGQYFYSQTALKDEKKEKERFMCFGEESCNNRICNYISGRLKVEKTIGSILQYGPGIHWFRTRIIEAFYEEFEASKSYFPGLCAVALLNGLTFQHYCKIFQDKLKDQGEFFGGIELDIEEPNSFEGTCI